MADDPNTPNDLRTKILRAIIRLCTTSGLYPRCLVLQDVQHGTECEAFGAFGDILLGSYKGHEVCLKVARTYRKPNVGDLFKVGLYTSHPVHGVKSVVRFMRERPLYGARSFTRTSSPSMGYIIYRAAA